MKSFVFVRRIQLTFIIMLSVLLVMPFAALASTVKPFCSLTVTTQNGSIKTTEGDTVLLNYGEDIKISWKSKNAEKAFANNNKVDLNGSATSSPKKTTTYNYKFVAGTKSKICKVTVQVVEGNIKSSTLQSLSSKPTITGIASGTRSVQIEVYKKNSEKVFFKSKTIKTKNGKWSAKITKKLEDGVYTVVLLGEKQTRLNTIATGTLAIGKKAISEQTKKTTFVAESIPLLVGGFARAGSSVPISYLQVINIGKETGKVESFVVKQNGNASSQTIVGFTISDDQGTKYKDVGTAAVPVVFKDGVAILPVGASIPSGEMKLFTIKAILSPNLSAYAGKQLKLDIAGINTNTAFTKTGFPIRGTTWTLQ